MSTVTLGDDLLTGLLRMTMDAVPGCLGVGISAAGHGRSAEPTSVAATGVASELDPAQWQRRQGPLFDAFVAGRVVMQTAEQHDALGADPAGPADPGGPAGPQGLPPTTPGDVRGAVFSPGEYGSDLPVVLSVYLDRAPDAATLRQVDRWEPLVTHALSMLEYCAGQEQMAAQMLQMTQHRRVIEQAKGLLMAATGSDAEAAFTALTRASQHFNIRLRTLAIALVELVGAGDAEQPTDADLVVVPTPQERAVAHQVWAALSTRPAMAPARPE